MAIEKVIFNYYEGGESRYYPGKSATLMSFTAIDGNGNETELYAEVDPIQYITSDMLHQVGLAEEVKEDEKYSKELCEVYYKNSEKLDRMALEDIKKEILQQCYESGTDVTMLQNACPNDLKKLFV